MAIRPATAARLRSLSQKSQNPQKQIINLFNQINLSEPQNSPFCAICERGVTTTAFILGRIAIRPYRSMSNAIGDGKPCLTAGGAKRNLRKSDASHLFGIEDVEHYCTSSRHILGRVYFPQAAPRRGLPAVMHGSAPSALLRCPPHNRL